MKKRLAALTIILIFSFPMSVYAKTYTDTGVVTDVYPEYEDELEEVEFTTSDGHIFTFMSDLGDWEDGDGIEVTMSDDVVVSARYRR